MGGPHKKRRKNYLICPYLKLQSVALNYFFNFNFFSTQISTLPCIRESWCFAEPKHVLVIYEEGLCDVRVAYGWLWLGMTGSFVLSPSRRFNQGKEGFASQTPFPHQTLRKPWNRWLSGMKMALMPAPTVARQWQGRRTWNAMWRCTWTASTSATFVTRSPRPEVVWPHTILCSIKIKSPLHGRWSHNSVILEIQIITICSLF